MEEMIKEVREEVAKLDKDYKRKKELRNQNVKEREFDSDLNEALGILGN